MTDPHDFDELASAHLDGVTSAEEAALVDADPSLQERVEELRAVRAALGEVPAVDPVRRDAAITAALAAFHEDGAERDAVVPLSPRRRLSPTTVRVLSAAAVVAILALLVPLLTSIDGGGDDEASFESTGDAIESADASTDGADRAESEASTTTGVAEASPDRSLGTYPDLDALADTVASGQLDASTFDSQTEQGLGEVRLCGPTPPPGTRVSTAVVAGEPVVVWVSVSPEGRTVLTVRRADGCEVIEEREL